MKLIIEMDREDYEEVKKHKGSYSFGNAIANGIPLEDIKAEIVQKSNEYYLTHDIEVQSQGYGLSEALEIIDKYNAESEHIGDTE